MSAAMRFSTSFILARMAGRSAYFGVPCVLSRTAFTAAGVGMDQYARIRELTAIRMGATSGQALRKRFVQDEQVQIFTEDIKNMLYIAENDAEIEAVIRAIESHRKQNVAFSNYRFGPPLMRMLTFLGKTDRAVEVFTSPQVGKFCEDSASALIICNHLMEQKRYNDVVKVFETALKRGFVTANGMAVPSDVLMLVVEALCILNTAQSFKKLEEILTVCGQKGCNFTMRTVGMAVVLAIKQSHPDVGLEFCGYIKQGSAPLVRNLKALCFADLGRLDEAFQMVKLIIQPTTQRINQTEMTQPSRRFNQHVYPIVMKHMRKAVESQPEYQQRLDELVRQVYNGQNMCVTDLETFLLTPLNRVYFGQAREQQNAQPYANNMQHQSGQHNYYQPLPPIDGPQQEFRPRFRPLMNRPPAPQYQQQQYSPPSYYSPSYQQTPQQQFDQQSQTRYFQYPYSKQGATPPPPMRPPIRSQLSGQPPSVIRSYSNPTSNRPPSIEDDDLDIVPNTRNK